MSVSIVIGNGELFYSPQKHFDKDASTFSALNSSNPFANGVDNWFKTRYKIKQDTSVDNHNAFAGLESFDFYSISLPDRIGTKAIKDACFITRECLPGNLNILDGMNFSTVFDNDRIPKNSNQRLESILTKVSFETVKADSYVEITEDSSDLIKKTMHRISDDSSTFSNLKVPDYIGFIDSCIYDRIFAQQTEELDFASTTRIPSAVDIGGKTLMRFRHYSVRIDKMRYPSTTIASRTSRRIFT